MFVKHVRDPVFGYIGLTDVEKSIIDTRPVQRLRRIKQLSVSDIVYPGGCHSRFSHSLGVMHVAGEIVDSLRENVDLSDDIWQLIRLGGLLHDVGHGPFSHTFESILSDSRDLTHEDMGKRVIEDSSLADEISAQGFEPSEVSELVFGEPDCERFLKQIITSQFDADKMDFLLRDSYFTGVEYGQIDITRLIQAMNVLDEDIAIDKKALSALEAFMIARYEMFLNVYYHHAVRAADIMLKEAMSHADGLFCLTDFSSVEEYLELDDGYVLNELRDLDPSDFSGEEENRAEIAVDYFKKLYSRDLIKTAYDRKIFVKDEYVAKLLSDEAVREKKEREIGKKADIDPEFVIVDVPTLASMPYYPRDIDPTEVPIIEVGVGGEESHVSLSDHSRLVDVLKGYVDLVRVYTQSRFRERVGRASRDIFKEFPLSARLSM